MNAARRASALDVGTPLRMLMEADGPRAIARDDALGADRLRAYRAEVQAELATARNQAPVFSADQPWASFGRGHDQASGGHLPRAQFNRLMESLGFDGRAQVPE